MVEKKQEPLPYLGTDCKGVSGNTSNVNSIPGNLFSSRVHQLPKKISLKQRKPLCFYTRTCIVRKFQVTIALTYYYNENLNIMLCSLYQLDIHDC